MIAHTPCENLYLKNMDYVVFNDLVNQKRCTEELLKTYVPELLYGNRDCQDILISRINEKTGGIPLAVYRLGNAIFEKELLRYEGNLEKFFCASVVFESRTGVGIRRYVERFYGRYLE